MDKTYKEYKNNSNINNYEYYSIPQDDKKNNPPKCKLYIININ